MCPFKSDLENPVFHIQAKAKKLWQQPVKVLKIMLKKSKLV